MIEIGPSQIDLLERLSNTSGISGAEGAVRDLVRAELQSLDVCIRQDALGNLLVTGLNEEPHLPRVMVAAHLDEVGFMLTAEDGEGLFRFAKVGGLRDKNLVGKAVSVGQAGHPGVIGCQPIHLTESKQRGKPVAWKELRIDVGPDLADEVEVGDYAVFRSRFFQQGQTLFGKALDDRFGVATLIELIKHPPRGVELVGAFTVQEEIGLRGAKVAAHALEPDLAVALESTPARDFPSFDPEEENVSYNARMGKGAAVYVSDGATISDTRLVDHVTATARKAGIPYQIRQPGGGGTDAAAIFRQRGGIPSISLSVPARCLHTAYAVADLGDWQAAAALIYRALDQLPADILDSRP